MRSTVGLKTDLALVLRSQVFEYLRKLSYSHAAEYLENRIVQKKIENKILYSYGNARLFLTILKACGWSGHIFAGSASPRTTTGKAAYVTSFRCSWRPV